MGTPSEPDTPTPSKLDEWIASLTNLERLEPSAAKVEAAARDIERSFIPGAFSDESRRRTAARLQAQSEAQRQDRVMADWISRAAEEIVSDPINEMVARGWLEWPYDIAGERVYLRYSRPWLKRWKAAA